MSPFFYFLPFICFSQWCEAFHIQQIALYAEHEPTGFLDFLQRLHRSGNSFNLSYALSVCRRRRSQLRASASLSARLRRLSSGDNATEVQEQQGDDEGTARSVVLDESGRQGENVELIEKEEGAILGLYSAEIYLLCHLGRHKEALNVLVNKLGVSVKTKKKTGTCERNRAFL